ncbi:CU044_2847 family protein [Micromonospora sp. NPDC051925]|uniref:CU044_2847 family protein n=1 Tax=Micromonospora sp. NPDC051925 TaxID=3364288 RepID=UPI0037CB73D6
MSQIVEFPLEDGGTIRFETADEDGTIPVGRAGAAVTRAHETLESALSHLRQVSVAVLRNLRDVAEPPDRVSVEFGVKVSAQTGLVVASGTSEANLTVQLEWNRPGTQP